MSYLYGDSTPSQLAVNYIEFLRDAVDCCVQLLLADQRIVEGRARTRLLDDATAAEIERLDKLRDLISKAIDGAPSVPADSATARCMAALVRSTGDLVRGEVATVQTALAAEIDRRDAQAQREREGCVEAIEVLLIKHDLPETSVDLHVKLGVGGHYAGRARIITGFGLRAVLDLDIPASHLFAQVVRVDRLTERLEVQAPEMSGWLHKEVKIRLQHLERYHITEVSTGSNGGTLKLRAAADGTGPGFDVAVSGEAPRVRVSRVDERESLPEHPFEPQEADAGKLLDLYQKASEAAAELGSHRKALVEAMLDGESLRTFDRSTLLVQRLVQTMAPVVREIAARSQSPGELVLRRLLADDRREEIFLPRAEIKRKLEPLVMENRTLFEPLWSEGSATSAERQPPVAIQRAAERVPPLSGLLVAKSTPFVASAAPVVAAPLIALVAKRPLPLALPSTATIPPIPEPPADEPTTPAPEIIMEFDDGDPDSAAGR